MPELPEAETVRRQLAEAVTGAKIRRVKVHTGRAARNHTSEEELDALVKGRTIREVGRRGKAILLFLDGKKPSTLILRLGMTGLIVVVPTKEPLVKHTAGVVELTDKRQIRFIDQRQFGLMVARPGQDVDAMPEFEKYGPEPFSEEFTPEYLKQALSRHSTNLEVTLMNQQVIAGIGKIYADEICFRAGLRPTRKANSLTGPMRERLWQATREVLAEACSFGGTTTPDESFRDLYGMAGRFADRLTAYQRTGEPCRVCGMPIKRTPMPGGRGMHWCPKCQK